MSGGDDNENAYNDYYLGLVTVSAIFCGVAWLRNSSPPPLPTTEMLGKTVALTGGTSGIGEAAALLLAKAGASIVIGARDLQSANVKVEQLKKKSGNPNIKAEYLDLAKMGSIDKFAKGLEKGCDVLINNAGAMFAKRNSEEQLDFEETMLVNHLSHWHLTKVLLPVLEKTAKSKNTESRIVNVGSRLEKTAILPTDGESRESIQDWMQHGLISYTTFQLYANSKLCMLSCSNELSRKLQATKTPVTVNTVTPGMVNTNLSRFMPLYLQYLSYPILYAMLRTPQKGAKTVVWAATAPELQGKTGLYFGDMKAIKGSDESLV